MSNIKLKMFLGGTSKPRALTQPSIMSFSRAKNRHILRELGGTLQSSKTTTPFRVVFNSDGTNPKYVHNTSDYIRYKKLQQIKRTYNN